MRLIAAVKLQPSDEQFAVLKETLETANAACNYISEQGWQAGKLRQYDLRSLIYYDVREKFGLSAQMTCQCARKVANAYKLDKKKQRSFKPYGAIAYDDRILTWRTEKQFVSIWCIGGRQKIPYVCGDRQRQLLDFQQGESDLMFKGGVFYVLATCNVEEPQVKDVKGVLGIDLGIVNIAADSDGETYSGGQVNGLRHRHRRLRSRLQSKGTTSAKRLLRQRRGKESRFAHDVNHCLSKRIVAKAKDTNRAIALEELKGIRSRTTVRKPQRATHSSWAFAQLREFVSYKAALAGIPVVFVDPANTSRTCPSCGCIDKRNRKSQAQFSCVRCGFSGLADHIAACNIASRAAVTQPYVEAAVGG